MLEFVSDAAARQAFAAIARQLVRSESSEWIHLDPAIQCEVKFQCLTKDGKLRSPSFQRFVFDSLSTA
ncbi:hypothetical protein B8V81_5078 [Paenibacillus pasadenensis]|uniref:DNA ligase (ATP) n=1 Tax=Paenibacillus pasadenensis TaxID=217090 RepID=A0A2N5MZN2_9BACL|nr:hypothetical protein B8V81_5078 [Paenibacillus pasadenensis]